MNAMLPIELVDQILDHGHRLGLPLIATCADISSARPAQLADGTPVASLFPFSQDAGAYWRQGDLALHNAIVTVARGLAEPFYFDRGKICSWRPLRVDPEIEREAQRRSYAVESAIVAPVHLPAGVIGAVVWATSAPGVDVAAIFDREAAVLHPLALRFIAACNAGESQVTQIVQHRLTRREVQCLKLAAAGKTDAEIGIILGLSVPTIRFHMRQASGRLGEIGRLRTVQRAVALGYARPN
ncbi:helix-turn-helix transcriptional regulator [Sphingobium yanoikuyae]|jgi:DNA-binding CsgD family transcriptional regulator|uniref:helix-turn-helix transcriptional regulator n=1 Tax=Sphingobium yanoikuyae TaxID=13690 RepID=UPI0028AD0F28|nr:helix-turn-helix transcriptional regulator [Sphingobium yanoikuyae]